MFKGKYKEWVEIRAIEQKLKLTAPTEGVNWRRETFTQQLSREATVAIK